MTIETQQTEEKKAVEQVAPAKEVVAAKAEPAKAKAAVEQEPAKAAPAQARRALKDDEDVPDTADLLELSAKALNGRLARHTKKQLRDQFGTDDFGEIKAKLDRLSELESKEEERRRADLSEKEKLAEDLRLANDRAESADRKYQDAVEQRMVDQEDSRIKDIAGEFVKMKHYKHVSRDLAEHLLSEYSEKALAKVTDAQIRKWFASYLEDNPEFAKAEAAAAAAAPAKAMMNNGADPKRPDAAATSGQAGVKTAKPGQPNSMTKKEISDLGYRW